MNKATGRRTVETDISVDKGYTFLGNGVHRIHENFGHLDTREKVSGYIDE